MNILAIGAGILLTCVPTTRHPPPQYDPEITTVRLADDLYLLEGAGGNVLAFLWDEGVLLVDDKIAPASARLKAAVAAITPKPIRFVINTHWHPDHRGGNEALAGEGTVIVAHENARRRMSVGGFVAAFGRDLPAVPPRALPVVTFTRDVTFHLGRQEISVLHVGPAHTDGDAFVLFRSANVLHMGDCYLNGSFPVVDSGNGGTLPGIVAAADTVLGLLDAQSRIIPGHGPVASSDDLRQWRNMVATIGDRVRSAAAAGKTLDQIKAERPAADWEGRFPRSFVTADHVIEEADRAARSGMSSPR